MSFVALIARDFETACRFYGEVLDLPEIARWERDHARGRRFDLYGLTLEILDGGREASAASVQDGSGLHLVAEVADVAAVYARLSGREAGHHWPAPKAQSWNAICFSMDAPDGVTVTFLQWRKT